MTAALDDPTRARALRLISLAGFASMASMRWCDSLLPVLAADFGRTTGEASRVIYAFAIAYGVMQLLYGPLGDRHGKTRVITHAALACTVGALACALAPGLGWLVAARVLSGAAAAGVIPMAIAWIGDHVPFAERQPVLARLLGYTVMGMIAGQWLAGVFADLLGWRIGFVFVALLFAVTGIAMRIALRSEPVPEASAPAGVAGAGPSSFERMREVLTSAPARRVLAVTAVEGGFSLAALAFAPSHLHGRFGLTLSLAGAAIALYGLGGLLYSRLVRWLLERLDPPVMARIGGLMCGACWVGFAVVPGWVWTLPLALAAGLGFYMIHNTLQLQATQMVPSQRGTSVSLFACVLFLGQSVGTGIAAWMVDWLSTGATIAGCGVGLAFVAIVVGRMPLPRAEAAVRDGDGTDEDAGDDEPVHERVGGPGAS